MIWRSTYHTKIAQLGDFLTGVLSFGSTWLIWDLLYSHNIAIIPRAVPIDYKFFIYIIIISLLYVFIFKNLNAYSYQRFTSLFTEYSNVLKVTVIGVFAAMAIAFFADYTLLRRTFFILLFPISSILFLLEKSFLFYAASIIRRGGYNRKSILIIGNGERTRHFIETVRNNFSFGLDIIGILSRDREKVGEKIDGIPVIDTYDSLQAVIKEKNPEEIVITISTSQFDIIREILDICERVGINVRLVSDFFGHMLRYVTVDNVFGLNIISHTSSHRKPFELLLKRGLDVVVSLIGLIILLPIFIAIALVIYFHDGRPILYEWNVMGKNRRPIKSWKFRTMVKNADELKEKLMDKNEMSGPVFKVSNDPRITPSGHFLRKYSLDELPQLFSVLKGDLSLVGPRPPLQSEFKEFDLWHRRKLSVKPGLTCLWQVNGRNDIVDFDEWAKLDLKYIDNWSIWLDLKILFKTIPAVVSGRGAK